VIDLRCRPDPVASLPEVIDLLSVAVRSGLPVAAALGAVSGRSPPPWRQALEGCLQLAAEGALLHEALGSLAAVGDEAAPLIGALRAGLVDGDRLDEPLARLAADARDLRRRRAQEQARRIPVRLLLPLVACSLPAFAVLTIVPILAGALHDLRWPP
jgi:tight adherence protein C